MPIVQLTEEQHLYLRDKIVLYNPFFLNGINKDIKEGGYVSFLIFSKSKEFLKIPKNKCIVEYLHELSKQSSLNYIKVGNFFSGGANRYSTTRFSFVQDTGQALPIAIYGQDVMLSHPELYMHYIQVVITENTCEKKITNALRATIENIKIDNKIKKKRKETMFWNEPFKHNNEYKISKSLSIGLQ
jgi:hypothetical protein